VLLERTALAVGLLLLSVYGLGMLHRSIGSRRALKAFDSAVVAGLSRTEREAATPVDFSLWSEKRIRAYKESLSILEDDPIAVLSIARLDVRAPIFRGTDELVLNRGLGWIEGTPKPGDSGNSGISGHRDGFFRALKDVRVGDSVEIKTKTALLVYIVDEIEIVKPEDVYVLRPRGAKALTLVTCYPFYFAGDAPNRFIVHAGLGREVVGQVAGKFRTRVLGSEVVN
jgi:sortase A